VKNNLEDQLPVITIGLTAYNRPDLLREAVLSIINQTYSNFELLIGNDYIKTPVTFNMLGIDPDPRIKILNYSSNMGEINNMNHLLNLAQSEWFVWLADDDVFHQSFLEMALNSINDRDGVVAVFSNYAAGNVLNSNFYNDINVCSSVNFSASAFIPKYVSKEVELIGCYGLMKTEKLKIIGGMPSLGLSFGPYSDTLIPILLSQLGSINYLKSSLCFLRTHDQSLTASSSEIEAYKSAEIDFLTELTNVCRTVININIDQCIFYMVIWFRDNEFSIISRNNSISRAGVVISFIVYQFKNNYSRISCRYWFRFTLSNIKLLTVVVINSIYKKISGNIINFKSSNTL
jgi:glycosyltransferase involved in cell wall biosynthesis